MTPTRFDEITQRIAAATAKMRAEQGIMVNTDPARDAALMTLAAVEVRGYLAMERRMWADDARHSDTRGTY